jgi:hypothetical protein
MFIENQTPYLGKLKLKFERHPHYSSGSNCLNKIHLDLGFTKLVSRLYYKWEKSTDEIGKAVDPKKVELIELYTDGKVGDHRFGPNDEYILNNSFLGPNGEYIGSLNEGWWYFKNGMTVCEDYPKGVAIVWNTSRFDKTVVSGVDGVKGYYGYSHRGGQLFKIGDRIFEEDYVPKKEDYPEDEWNKYMKKFAESYRTGDDFDQEWLFIDGVKSVVPFNRRGSKTIRNWGDALTAAINMSKYLG